MNQLRPQLETIPLPARMRELPIDERGFPVPWFVQWMKDGEAAKPGEAGAKPEFRVMDVHKLRRAQVEKLCWCCGKELGAYLAFVIGPMCAVNRNTAEPPNHRDCAIYAARACPFLSMPKMERRESGLPEDIGAPAGIAILRNPGVALVWVTKRYQTLREGKGFLFRLGDPEEVLWFAEGRDATREEVLHSITTGIPLLEAQTESDEERAYLQGQIEKAMSYVPQAALARQA